MRRSRAEPGCISHNVHVDAENPMKLVFVERWSDMATLQTHFAVPASRAFVKSARTHAAEPAEMQIYQASEVKG